MRLLLAIPILAAVGVGFGVLSRPAPPSPVVEVVEPAPEPTVAPVVVVDVTGAVVRPGVVTLPAGSRVIDALLAAGGMAAEADADAVNRAAPLRDGGRVHVPRVGETPPAGSIGTASETRIDINRATAAELDSLPGIGEVTAAKIIRAREERPFQTVDELQTRGLLSARVLADIRDLVTTR
ncbi:MAG: ComEA family DNA-binding protein [Candidatus Limnocylindria bacterium]